MQRPGTTGARPAGIARAATPGVLTLSLLCAAVIAGSRTAGAVDAIACDTGLPASTMGLFDGHDHLRNITNAAEGEAKLDELAVEGIALATPDGVGEMTLRHSGPIALATDIAPGGGQREAPARDRS